MKRIALILTACTLQLISCNIWAQAPKSRVAKATQTKTATGKAAGNTATVDRASLMFPTAVDMPEDVSWRRDIYRRLDLTLDENAPLYYPVEQQGDKVNLFTLLFTLLNQGKIPAYECQLDGLENFNPSNRMHFRDMLDRRNIYYEVEGNTIKVQSSDIPSSEVTRFDVKETTYYDQNTATFHSHVTAICPVLLQSDEWTLDGDDFGGDEDLDSDSTDGDDPFSDDLGPEPKSVAPAQVSSGGEKRPYPLFWVKMEDIEPYLSQHMIMISNVNNAAQMSMADFFATNKYKGSVYHTTNMQNKLLSTNPELRKKEEAKIEKQLKDFEDHLWAAPIDSVAQARKDSIAALNVKEKKTKTEKASRTERTSTSKKEKSSSSSSSGSSTPRVSVRRQRH